MHIKHVNKISEPDQDVELFKWMLNFWTISNSLTTRTEIQQFVCEILHLFDTLLFIMISYTKYIEYTPSLGVLRFFGSKLCNRFCFSHGMFMVTLLWFWDRFFSKDAANVALNFL